MASPSIFQACRSCQLITGMYSSTDITWGLGRESFLRSFFSCLNSGQTGFTNPCLYSQKMSLFPSVIIPNEKLIEAGIKLGRFCLNKYLPFGSLIYSLNNLTHFFFLFLVCKKIIMSVPLGAAAGLRGFHSHFMVWIKENLFLQQI